VHARVFASLTLALSFLAGPAALAVTPSQALAAGPARASAAQGDEVAVAQAQVDRLQLAVRETTARLIDGTEKWEHDQAALRRVRGQLAAVTAKVKQQEGIAAAGRARVAVVARRMYMTPLNDQLRLAMGMNAEQIIGMIQTQGELHQVAASDGEVVRRARLAQLQLDRDRQQVVALTRSAQQLVERSAQRLRELNALADKTSAALQAAEDQLVQARARKAARLAKLAAQRALAQRLAYLERGGAYCKNSDTAGQTNGNIDPDSLCPLWMAPGQRLRTDASKAFNAMSRYHAKVLRQPLCVTDSYRSYARQVDVYHRKPGLAAVPGTSQHGWGLAVDLCGGVQTYGSPAFNWMKANAARFGFFHPGWAEPSGSRPEAWHWEYRPAGS
jgi:LAS superfamily LD-carboxypeptidase LdcB